MWHVTHDMWHATCDAWNVTCDTLHVTCGRRWTFSHNFRSLALMVWVYWCLEDWEAMDLSLNELINELISDEGIYRTAPATPGLLNILAVLLLLLLMLLLLLVPLLLLVMLRMGPLLLNRNTNFFPAPFGYLRNSAFS